MPAWKNARERAHGIHINTRVEKWSRALRRAKTHQSSPPRPRPPPRSPPRGSLLPRHQDQSERTRLCILNGNLGSILKLNATMEQADLCRRSFSPVKKLLLMNLLCACASQFVKISISVQICGVVKSSRGATQTTNGFLQYASSQSPMR